MDRLNALLASPEVSRAILVGALVLARIVPIVVLFPALGGRLTPTTVKMGIAVVLTAILFPVVSATTALPVAAPLAAMVLIVKEVFVGITIGTLVSVVFFAIESAGVLVDTARGATLVTAIVPELGTRDSAMANLKFQLAIVIFFAVSGHTLVVAALAESFRVIPVDRFVSAAGMEAIAVVAIQTTASLFTIAFALAAPVIGVALVADVVLAFLARVAPQTNVFMLGMPLKGLLGVLAFLAALGLVAPRLVELLLDATASVPGWVVSLSR